VYDNRPCLIHILVNKCFNTERIGDHATDISEITIELSKESYIKKLDHIQQMAKETTVQSHVPDDQSPRHILLHLKQAQYPD